MTASEIAETLINGNIAQARYEILDRDLTEGPPEYAAAVMALRVAEELAYYYQWGEYPGDDTPPLLVAIRKVRRCLEGAP